MLPLQSTYQHYPGRVITGVHAVAKTVILEGVQYEVITGIVLKRTLVYNVTLALGAARRYVRSTPHTTHDFMDRQARQLMSDPQEQR